MKPKNINFTINRLVFLLLLFLLTSPSFAQDRTSTGFYYPTGTSNPPGTGGTWLATGCDTYSPGRYHLGYDLFKPRGNPVYAMSNGTNVTVFANSDPNVSFIWIKHEVRDPSNNLSTVWAVYGHITARAGLGTTVNAGEVIGYIMPYPESQDHCHFGINMVDKFNLAVNFTINYVNSSNQTVQATASVGWGRGSFIPLGNMPNGWCSHASVNRNTLEKRGYTDPLAFIRSYRPAEGATSTDIYVDAGSNGNDNNSGTSGSPFKTLAKALSFVSPGTPRNIYCMPGYIYRAPNGRIPPRCNVRRWGGSGTVIIRKQ